LGFFGIFLGFFREVYGIIGSSLGLSGFFGMLEDYLRSLRYLLRMIEGFEGMK